jgi:nitroreductase
VAVPSLPLDRLVVESAVTAATRAPSVLNSQPWRFHAHDDRIDVYVVPERAPTLLDPAGREVFASVGAAILNLRLALEAAGRAAVVQLTPSALDRRFAASVRVLGPVRQGRMDRALAEVIPRRRTSRAPFTEEPVPYQDFQQLQEAAAVEGAQLEVATGLHRAVVVEALRSADREQRGDARLVDHVRLWTVARAGNLAVGIPVELLGPQPDHPSAVVRDVALGLGASGRPVASFEPEALLAVLLTSDDRARDWLRAGMALERVLLTATLLGLSVGLLSQAMEIPDLRWLVRDPASGSHHPQVVLRLGYGQQPPPTPRLPLHDVLRID